MTPARISLAGPIHKLTPQSAAWPGGFNALAEPPAQIYVAGRLPDASAIPIAIVGTRYASEDACCFTRRLARELCGHGAVIVSGGAAGIDAAAHEGALEAGGVTVSILATGLVRAYPSQHAQLFGRIARTGALLCEQERPTRRAYEFLRRNRLIAALAQSVVIVQAPARSGALSTARWAKTLGRPLFVVPSAPWDEHGWGGLGLLREDAEVCISASDILSVANKGARPPDRAPLGAADRSQQASHLQGLSPKVRRVLAQVRSGVHHPDDISVTLDMNVAEVQEGLLDLVLRGVCRQRSDGGYVCDR